MKQSLFIALLLAHFVVNTTSNAADSQTPNILFLFADDWGRYASIYAEVNGAGGINDVVRTPNIDKVARSGVLFRNAHVNAPSCTPCRSALLSGQYFWRTGRGAILRGAVWDPSIPAFPMLLHDNGYHIGKTYKVWSPGTPADAPYGGQTYSFDKAGSRFNQFSQNVTKLIEKGQTVDDSKTELYSEIRNNFKDFLIANESGKPFCYWFGPTNVHRSWTKGSGKALWNINPDDLKGKMPPYLPDVPEVREDLADYFGEIAAWDAGVGVLLAELEGSGQRDNTLIVISGDHGAPGFPHGKCNLYGFGTGVSLVISGPGVVGGRVVNDFVNLTDLAPTFLETAGLTVPDVMTGRSLWPLLKSTKSGQIEEARTWVITGRERHVEIARADYSPYPQRAIHTAEHLLIINFKPDRWPLGDPYRLEGDDQPTAEEITKTTRTTHPDEDAGPTKAWLIGERNSTEWKSHYDWVYGKRPMYELYDLKKDPHETKNVADDPVYATVKAALEQQLLGELTRTGDPRLIDDGKFFETPPMSGPIADEDAFWGTKRKGQASEPASKKKAKKNAEDSWVVFETRTDASLRGLAAVNKDVAWACGSLGTVIETTDGGKNWLHHTIEILQAVEIRAIHAWDSDKAIVATAGQPALIMKTVDRGVTWTAVYENKSTHAFFDGMKFWNDRSGVAFSDPIDGDLLIVTTNDGGDSWHTVAPADIPKMDAGEAGFAASNSSLHLFGIQDAWIGLGGSDGGASRVLRSQDVGAHWTSQSVAPIARGSSSGIFSIAFENASRGVAVGGDYKLPSVDTQNIAITDDGGLNWREPKINRPNGFRSSVVVIQPNGADTITRWLACGPSGCDWSVHGEEWFVMSHVGFHSLSVAPDRSVWAAGSMGRVACLAMIERK